MKPWFILLCATLTACSPVNSVAPFDNEQAEILIRENIITKPTRHMISLTLPDKEDWKKLTTSPVILIPRDETAENWNQKILASVYPYHQQADITATTVMENKIADLKQNCADIHVNLLANTHQYLLYQIDMANCKDARDQKQINKLFMGNDAIYSVRYIAIKGNVSAKEWRETAAAIKNAWLVSNPAAFMKKPSHSLFSSSILNFLKV